MTKDSKNTDLPVGWMNIAVGDAHPRNYRPLGE